MLHLLLYGVLAIALGGGLFALAARFLPAGEQIAPAVRDEPPWELPPDRALRPEDVDAVRLPVALRGYRFAETDILLDRLAGELAARDREIARLRGEFLEADAADSAGAPVDAVDGTPVAPEELIEAVAGAEPVAADETDEPSVSTEPAEPGNGVADAAAPPAAEPAEPADEVAGAMDEGAAPAEAATEAAADGVEPASEAVPPDTVHQPAGEPAGEPVEESAGEPESTAEEPAAQPEDVADRPPAEPAAASSDFGPASMYGSGAHYPPPSDVHGDYTQPAAGGWVADTPPWAVAPAAVPGEDTPDGDAAPAAGSKQSVGQRRRRRRP